MKIKKFSKKVSKNLTQIHKENEAEIILEIADVQIMLMQLIEIYKIDGNKLLGAIEYKLLRQKERIENESKTELN